MGKISLTREFLGSKISIFAVGDDLGKVEDAFLECRRIEKKYSRFIHSSDLSKLNRAVGEWVSLDEEFFDLVRWGREFRSLTSGFFDITVKSILDKWGYDEIYSFEERELGGLGDIELDFEKQRVRLGAEIDLGGFGKGYALDQMALVLDDLENVCIDAGGDIFATGSDEDDKPWRVAFEHPMILDEAIGFVDVDGFFLACSNAKKRSWRDKHHLVDVATGQPACEMMSVYTQADSGVLADTFATALFVMGFEKAREFLCTEGLDVEAMLVGKEGRVFRSKGFKGELFEAE